MAGFWKRLSGLFESSATADPSHSKTDGAASLRERLEAVYSMAAFAERGDQSVASAGELVASMRGKACPAGSLGMFLHDVGLDGASLWHGRLNP